MDFNFSIGKMRLAKLISRMYTMISSELKKEEEKEPQNRVWKEKKNANK